MRYVNIRAVSCVLERRVKAYSVGHEISCILWKSDIYFCVDKKNQLDVTFVFLISLLIVAQHVSGNRVPIIRS